MLEMILSVVILCGCSTTKKPRRIEYYPPITEEQIQQGHGPVKVLDYNKPGGGTTLFGISFSIF